MNAEVPASPAPTVPRTISVPDTARPAARHRGLKRARLAAVALAALLGGGAYGYDWWTTGRFVESTDDAYVGGDVTPIAPHVAGFVQQVLVTDHQLVQAGQPLIRLDPKDYQAALQHAQAVLDGAKARLEGLDARRALQQALITGAAADLAARQAQAVFATQDADRYRMLASTYAGTRQDEQKALAGDRSAKAGVLAAQAALEGANRQLAVIDSDVVAARAEIAQATADLRTAELNLGYTELRAPIAGYVGNRSAQVGAYVGSGTTLLAVVPARGLWVDANFKEDQLARMRPGDPATVVADVLPGRVFHGRVESLAPVTGAVFSIIPPQNATGNFTKIVQRVPVRIALDGDGQELGLLRAGLSTTVRVDTKHDAP
ncbi:MAG: HlyD family secretion protein [Rhodospirillales bacterium]|nr:HlyD family secretion protein [Rhodospirillales bacterium]